MSGRSAIVFATHIILRHFVGPSNTSPFPYCVFLWSLQDAPILILSISIYRKKVVLRLNNSSIMDDLMILCQLHVTLFHLILLLFIRFIKFTQE